MALMLVAVAVEPNPQKKATRRPPKIIGYPNFKIRGLVPPPLPFNEVGKLDFVFNFVNLAVFIPCYTI